MASHGLWDIPLPPFARGIKDGSSDNLKCVDEFEVDAECHIVMVEARVFVLGADVLQGTRIPVVAAVDEAHVLAFVKLGIATGAFLLHGLFESVLVLILRQYACEAHRLVDYFGLLHHELQGDVVDGLLVHTDISFIGFTMQTYADVRGEKKKESFGNFLSFSRLVIRGLCLS